MPASPAISMAINDASVSRNGTSTQANLPKFAIVFVL
jgi:hypothetical protein